MNTSTDTTDGLPSKCYLCGKQVWVSPSSPFGDATCPHCGTLLWFVDAIEEVEDPIHRLAELGAVVKIDPEGQVQAIKFRGDVYNNSTIRRLAELRDVPLIDISETAITKSGARLLKRLLPHAKIIH